MVISHYRHAVAWWDHCSPIRAYWGRLYEKTHAKKTSYLVNLITRPFFNRFQIFKMFWNGDSIDFNMPPICHQKPQRLHTESLNPFSALLLTQYWELYQCRSFANKTFYKDLMARERLFVVFSRIFLPNSGSWNRANSILLHHVLPQLPLIARVAVSEQED